MQQFRDDVDDYGANIVSLDKVLEMSDPQGCKWSAWLCTHPRLSRFLIRAELKLWQVTLGNGRGPTPVEANFPSPVTRHSSHQSP
jgi:hypothetical protein